MTKNRYSLLPKNFIRNTKEHGLREAAKEYKHVIEEKGYSGLFSVGSMVAAATFFIIGSSYVAWQNISKRRKKDSKLEDTFID